MIDAFDGTAAPVNAVGDIRIGWALARTAAALVRRDRLRTLTIHHGRHTFISHALAGGRTLAEVRDAAGPQQRAGDQRLPACGGGGRRERGEPVRGRISGLLFVPGSISKYESGVSPSIDMLERIAKAVSCAPELLVFLGLTHRFPGIEKTDLGRLMEELGQLVTRERQKSVD